MPFTASSATSDGMISGNSYLRTVSIDSFPWVCFQSRSSDRPEAERHSRILGNIARREQFGVKPSAVYNESSVLARAHLNSVYAHCSVTRLPTTEHSLRMQWRHTAIW